MPRCQPYVIVIIISSSSSTSISSRSTIFSSISLLLPSDSRSFHSCCKPFTRVGHISAQVTLNFCFIVHTSHVTHHTSHVTRHTSHVTRHASNVTNCVARWHHSTDSHQVTPCYIFLLLACILLILFQTIIFLVLLSFIVLFRTHVVF